MQYRAEIDGLRTVAVGSVVAYHVGLSLGPVSVRGGFSGVDVFFVISGYLITGLLLESLDDQAHTIANFYRRRVRRILPGLFAMLLVTSVVAPFALFADQLADFAHSLLATALFSSNFYFWSTSSYFAGPSDQAPLLHTWSLAVEEQYYIVWPLLLAVLFRFGRRTIVVALAALTVVSLVLCVAMTARHPEFTFYLLPARAWELAIGGLCAVTLPRLAERWPGPREALAAVGLAALVLGAFALDPDQPYPGYFALLPTLGTAAVIMGGSSGPAARTLRWRPFVLVGLVSYSWYLWHWPAVVFYSALTLRQPHGLVWPLILAAGSLVVAVAAYRLVERPCRRAVLPGVQVLRAITAFVVVVAILSVGVRPFASRVNPEDAQDQAVRRSATFDVRTAMRVGTCFITSDTRTSQLDSERCLTPAKKHNVLVMGDSHAADLWLAVHDDLGPRAHVLQATASGCLPLMPLTGLQRCTRVMRRAYAVLRTRQVQVVILSGNWANNDVDVDTVSKTVSYLRRYVPHVVVVGPALDYSAPLPQILAKASGRDKSDYAASFLTPGLGDVDRDLQRAVSDADGSYFSLLGSLCRRDRCRIATATGDPVLFDSNHFTTAGAELALEPLIPLLASMAGSRD